MPSVPPTLGPYEIQRLLGSGGMSQVFLARKADGPQPVALKVLSDEKAQKNPIFLGRFQREISTMMTLEHPHIVRIHDAGEADGHYYLVMELLEGESVKERLGSGPLSVDEIFRLIRQSCQAMDYCHGRGVLHQDLKPTNVFYQSDGNFKILDFGLAKGRFDEPLTTVGRRIGTPRYMAPEVIRGTPADAKSDIYQLGLIYYESATSKAAFPDTDVATVLRKVLTTGAIPLSEAAPQIPFSLSTLIQNCLVKDPLLRYQSIFELASDLDVALSGGVVAPRPLM